MMRRNGGIGKVIAGVLMFFGAVYIIYLYNDLSGQLKNTERTAERYRREQESVSNQLQDLTASKNELKQRCDNDKTEMTNRLNSLNQQHKMLKSQHDDMESEFGRLQSEHEREGEEHKRLDEERNLEYNQFKQEKILEISNLRDAVANFEREKEQLNEEITKLKQQLQNSLNLVQQAQQQQHIPQQQQQQQQQFVPQQQQQQQGGLQQGQNVQQGAGAGQLNFNPQQQGVFQQQQQPLVAAQNQVNLPNEGMNIADEILESLKDKHKPLDADQVEEQQKQHQILPPIDHKALNEDKEASKEGQGVRDHVVEGAHKDDHDNRMENQGPVGLQVQEPRMKPAVDNQQDGGGNLLFRPKVPEVLDNQIQPHMPVDDSLKQEQMVKPMNFGEQQADHMNQIDRDDNLEHDEDEEEDDENYDDKYDNENDNEKDDDGY